MKKNKSPSKNSAQQVRIIGGSHRRRIVSFIEAEGLRPTPDRVREQVFNWLGQRLTDCHVLDLFAGSGVMAMEASSRGAARVDAVELNRVTAKTITTTVQALQLPNLSIHTGNALQYLQDASAAYDVVFLDPPYIWNEWDTLWSLLKPHCVPEAKVYVEAASLPELPSWLCWSKQDHAGQSHYGLALVQDIDL